MADLVRSDRLDVVIFDTLASLWPCSDENDASKVLLALTPLHHLTRAGAAVLLVHHPRKSDGGEGQASRGSSALPGWVDVILEWRRFDPQSQEDCRRTLKGFSRFDETPADVVVELTAGGFRTVGNRGDAKRSDRLEGIADLVPETPPGMTVEEVRDAWSDGTPRPGIRTLRGDLGVGVSENRWHRTGTGNKGDPARYWQNAIPARSTPIEGPESNSVDSPDPTLSFCPAEESV